MKGISPIIAVILIVMIVTALATSLYTFLSRTQAELTTGIEQQQELYAQREGAELKIININSTSGEIVVRNTGRFTLDNFAVFIDEQPADAQVPNTLPPGGISIINITSPSGVKIKITTSLTSTEAGFP